MAKKDNHKDSTTDFFLKFITRQKEEKKEVKKEMPIKIEDTIGAREKAYTYFIKGVNLINSTLDKMLSSKLSVKILSFALTIILVFVIHGGSVSSILATPTSGDFITEVPIEVEGLSEEYEISGVPESVNIMMTGPSLDIYTTKASKKYEVFLDVSNLGEGEHTVDFKTKNFPSDLQIAVQPASATIKLSPKVTSTFKLGYRFINEDKMDSAYSASVSKMEHDQVEVRGAQETINKIYTVEANIDLTGVQQSFSQNAVIYAYDRSGAKLNVSITPSKVNVDCTVTSYSKEVNIVPIYKGQLDSGFAIANAKLSKATTMIFGDEDTLKNIKEVYVNVDITGFNQNITLNNLPITKVDGINKMADDKVSISLEIEEENKKTLTDIPITINNNTENYNIGYNENENTVSIEVSGAKSLVEKITSNDVVASIDVKDLQAGRHVVPVTVKLSNSSMTFTFITPKEITIKLEK